MTKSNTAEQIWPPMSDIFARARAVHESATTAAEVQAALSAVLDEVVAAQAARAAAEAIVIDPFAEQADVEAADRAIGAGHVRERRLAEASRILGARLAELQDQEEDTRRRGLYDAARARRDVETSRISAAWTLHASALVSLLDDMVAADSEVARMYDKPPAGCGRIPSVLDGVNIPHPTTPNLTMKPVEALSIPAVPQWGAPGFRGVRVMLA